MWVEKKPRRRDFCGCVGCPLCYNWCDDIEAKKPETERIVVPGPLAMGLQLMQKKELTQPEKKLMEDAAERIHQANIQRTLQVEIDFTEANEKRALEVFLETSKTNPLAKRVPPKPRNKTLDDMTPAELEAASKPKKKTYNPIMDDVYSPADMSQGVLEQKAIWEDKMRKDKKRQQEAMERAKAAYYSLYRR